MKSTGQSGQSASPTSPPPLSYRDVFLLTSTYELVDEETDQDGVVTSAASGLLAGLRGEDIPFKVVSRGDSAALREVAEGSPDDAVVVADADSVRGLERKVVIWVPYDKGVGSGEMDFARLDAMSRATAQLVVID
ncbi:hypothetical protein BaRGS_00031386 [Batillaria attramentaria]|uniref:Uncharacterized protein n=1 Tax=Batillaria attramentaria TaxID=370345 RepID=A0ABD0JQL2_9CAEN|nr:hypothetical protein BaRGS_001217 [Batillaria attramentaria]